MAMISTEEFVGRLRQHQLFNAQQLAKLDLAAKHISTQALIERLVGARWLTAWQVEQLAHEHNILRVGGFRLVDRLATGTGSEILLAQHDDGRRMACKIWAENFFGSGEDIAYFERAVRAASALTHPNIVAIDEYGQIEGREYLTMEWVPGPSLQTIVDRRGALSIPWACECIRQIALGLQHAFLQGLSHGRLRPSKLIVTSPDQNQKPTAKLLGVSISQATRRDMNGSTVMTGAQLPQGADYVAPELALEPRMADITADLYSLGGIFFFLLTGRLPFPGDTPLAIWRSRFEQAPIPVTAFRPEVPAAIETLINRLLARLPQQRLRTAGELAAGLAPYCEFDVPFGQSNVLDLTTGTQAASGKSTTVVSRANSATRESAQARLTPQPSGAPSSASSRNITSSSTSTSGAGGAVTSSSKTTLATGGGKVQRLSAECEAWLAQLEKVGLLEPDQSAELRSKAAAGSTPEMLNEPAVRWGWLSHWQINEAKNGRQRFMVGRYRLVEFLSKHGSMQVFRAADPNGHPVLLKTVPHGHALDAEQIARLQREGRVTACLQHKNLLGAHELGLDDGLHFLALEYVPGPTLKDLIDASGKLPIPFAVEVIRQAAIGVQVAAQKKLYHRSLTPANIIVGTHDFTQIPPVKVFGWGSSHTEDSRLKGSSVTDMETLIGSADYLAPEQNDSPRVVDSRADVYSLGCILFHALTGQVPFDGASAFEKIDLRAKEAAPKAKWIRPDIPPDLDHLIQRIMDRNPLARPKDPLALCEALKPYGLQQVAAAPQTQQVPGGKAVENLEEFFGLVQKCQLLNAQQWVDIRRAATNLQSPPLLANRLVDQGLLTKWQATALLNGKSDLVYGEYTLIDFLGNGVNTTTYLAQDAEKHLVAVRILKEDLAAEREAVTRFHRGGRLSQGMRHPRLVKVEKSIEEADRHYQVLEHLRGVDLKEWLRLHKKMPLGWACEVARQCAVGLQHLHDKQIVHRDIRPAKLMLVDGASSAGVGLKILALGLATTQDPTKNGTAVTQQGELLGSPDYMAPEQAEDASKTTAQSDLYSLGSVLYHLLSGQLAYEGPTPVARLSARFHDPPPKLRQTVPEAPQELEDLIIRLLSNEPEGRPQTAKEIAGVLARFAQPLPPKTEDMTQVYRAPEVVAPSATAQDFINILEETRFLPPETLAEIRRRFKEDVDAKTLTNELTSRNILTPWQAEQLLSGRRDLRVAGKYRLQDQITQQQGAEATFEATDPLGRRVAVSVVSVSGGAATANLERLAREGRLPAIVDHPHLAGVIDAGVEGNGWYIVWERMVGCDLQTVLNRGETLPIAWACECIRQAALGLEHGRQHGLLHRFLVPRDIWIGSGDLQAPPNVKVGRVGLANVGEILAAATSGASKQAPDCVEYIAPEQIDQPNVADTRSDIYSLGCILYQMITGRVPFSGMLPMERLMARFRNDPPPVGELRSDATLALEGIVARMLAREPKQRYQTPNEVAVALAAVITQQGGITQSISSNAHVAVLRTMGLEQLFSLVEQSRLIKPSDLLQIRKDLKGDLDATEVGDWLINGGFLTKWQFNQILLGSNSFYLGRYRMIDCLGRGAAGSVYKAEDADGKIVALKVLASEMVDDQEGLARFQREGRVAAHLKHPNIAAVLEALEEGDKHFLVMEYVEGHDLKYWIQIGSPLPIGWVCECIRQAACALEYAQREGVVHRDIKPSNLFVVGDSPETAPKIKVLDMGVANISQKDVKGNTVTKMGEILGTPDYMSPEQAQNPSQVDTRADIYSLGCTLFHALTGRVPFDGDTPMAKLTSRFKKDAPPLRNFRRDAPPELGSILAKMLSRDPDHRYQSPIEVADALEAWCDFTDAAEADLANTKSFDSPEVEEFFAHLQRSDVLPPEQLAAVRRFAVKEADPRTVARHCIDQQYLSRWQAKQLMEGRNNFWMGDYQLLDMIGRGATGFVYKAYTRAKQQVALKVLNAELLKKPEAVARFRREMRVVAALSHPNIVTAYDAGQLDEQTYYIAMEYVAGRDLKSWLSQCGALPIPWACECIRQAALALQHAHEVGIIHRDIKPGNMLVIANTLEDKPKIKLLDLGFANVTAKELKDEALTKHDQLLGTPDYMSPEQAENPTTADIRSDIYSLGCTLFRLLTNRPPFQGNTPIEKLNARFQGDAPKASQFRPEIAPELDAVIAKLLERDPDKRIQTPQEVSVALEPFAMGGDSSLGLIAKATAFAGNPAGQHAPLGIPAGAADAAPRKRGLFGAIAGVFSYFTGGGGGGRGVTAAQGQTITNLLSVIDPVRDSVAGNWEIGPQGLMSPNMPYARLQVPIMLPAEYTVHITAERLDGDAALAVGFLVGDSQCFLTLDGWGGTCSGLGLINSRPYDANPTTFKGRIFDGKRPKHLTIQVTSVSVRFLVDNREYIAWAGDSALLSLFPAWTIPSKRALFIGAHTSVYRIREFKLASVEEPQLIGG